MAKRPTAEQVNKKRNRKKEKELSKARAEKLKRIEEDRRRYEEKEKRLEEEREARYKAYLKAKKEKEALEKKEERAKAKVEKKERIKKALKGPTVKDADYYRGHLTLLERIAAYPIDFIDHYADIISWAIQRFLIRTIRKLYSFRVKVHNSIKIIAKDAIVIAFVCVAMLIAFSTIYDYEYSYNGRALGIVHEETDVLDVLELVSDELSAQYNSTIKINPERDITFRWVFSMGKDIDDQDTVLKRLSYMGEIQTEAYAIVADGKTLVIVESETIANKVLSNVQANYLLEDEDYSYIGFVEDVKIESVPVQLSEITNEIDATNYIASGAVEEKLYTVVSGDTLYGIASKNGITYSELKKLNPNIKDTMIIHAGDKFKVQQQVPLLTVKTVGVRTFAEAVPYETTYKESSSYYVGESVVSKAGKDGKASVTATLTKINGEITEREDISSVTIIEPTTKIVIKGTKPTPPKQGTGIFKKPVSYRINSGYGMRYSFGAYRMHKGVDFACPTGTAVRASDGGTVIMSKWYGDYGYCVEIDHGGGYTTLYGHNSRLAVKAGEKVYQGQIIAYAGSTGRSTGPHVHFEIMYLGKNVDPAKYLSN